MQLRIISNMEQAIIVSSIYSDTHYNAGISEDLAVFNKYEAIKSEIDRLRKEVERHSEILNSKSEAAETKTFPDPAKDKNIWNLNSISVVVWKTSFWPAGQQWNHDTGQFERHRSSSQRRMRSSSEYWIESRICPLLFTIFPLLFVFVEMCILAGIMDQGTNVKTHIYGDGFYQSPIWRYSGSAYLRVKFVPILNSSGIRIGMTSDVDVFNHSMLRDRPASEALQCLDNNYIMPFNRYQACVPCLVLKRRNIVTRYADNKVISYHETEIVCPTLPTARPSRTCKRSPQTTTLPSPPSGASSPPFAPAPTRPRPSPTASPGSTPPSAPPSGAPTPPWRPHRPRRRPGGAGSQ